MRKTPQKVIQVSEASNISLPNIKIPNFSGKHINEFKPFMDMFEAVINVNSKLKNVEKLSFKKLS